MTCNRCGSCNCSCNRNISFGSNSRCCQTSSRVNACDDPVVYVKTNFIVLADNVILEIEVTDSSLLYEGEGIRIGDGYFQIAEIIDSTTISIVQNGTATPGLQITAVHPSYGCYQYPILYVGAVDQLIVPEIAGLDSSFVVVGDSLDDPTMQMTYSYLGPKKVEFEFECDVDITDTITYLQIDVPVEVEAGAPQATFSAMIDNGTGFGPAIAYRRNQTIVIAINAALELSLGSTKFRITGIYDLQ